MVLEHPKLMLAESKQIEHPKLMLAESKQMTETETLRKIY
jgi:hypothetical protein